ncbi:MAG: HIT family protein [Planctomycetota bacterium]
MMKKDDKCIFCKIVKKEIPSHLVYEAKNVIALLDIRPINPGHTLVVIKHHYSLLEELPKEYLYDLSEAIQKVGNAIKIGLNVQGYNVVLNNGRVAGQVIPHIHFHIVPRHPGDGLSFHPPGKTIPDSEFTLLADRIKKYII